MSFKTDLAKMSDAWGKGKRRAEGIQDSHLQVQLAKAVLTRTKASSLLCVERTHIVVGSEYDGLPVYDRIMLERKDGTLVFQWLHQWFQALEIAGPDDPEDLEDYLVDLTEEAPFATAKITMDGGFQNVRILERLDNVGPPADSVPLDGADMEESGGSEPDTDPEDVSEETPESSKREAVLPSAPGAGFQEAHLVVSNAGVSYKGVAVGTEIVVHHPDTDENLTGVVLDPIELKDDDPELMAEIMGVPVEAKVADDDVMVFDISPEECLQQIEGGAEEDAEADAEGDADEADVTARADFDELFAVASSHEVEGYGEVDEYDLDALVELMQTHTFFNVDLLDDERELFERYEIPIKARKPKRKKVAAQATAMEEKVSEDAPQSSTPTPKRRAAVARRGASR